MPNLNLLSPMLPVAAGKRLVWQNLHGSSSSLAIAQAAQRNIGPTIVITPDSLIATRLENELRFYNPDPEQIPILTFPDWETLPYDTFSPHQDLISQRLMTLYQIPQLQQAILVIPIASLMHKLPPRTYINANSFILDQGNLLKLDAMRQRFEASGYRCVTQVMEHGEFAIRGSIIDLYPMGSELPYRIDLFDEEVDSIRTFDPETQRSISAVDSIRLLPAREFPLTDEGITVFRQNWRSKFEGNPGNCTIYQDISQGNSSAGIEYYLPLFFSQLETLFDYLPPNSLMVTTGDLNSYAENFWTEVNERYEQRRHDITRPILSPHELFIPANLLFQQLGNFAQIRIHENSLTVATEDNSKTAYATFPPPNLTINNKSPQPLAELEQFLNATPARILFCAETTGRRETVLELLNAIQIRPTLCNAWSDFLTSNTSIGITVAPLDRGLYIETPSIAVITESQLFGQQVLQRRRRFKARQDTDAIIKNLAELRIGNPVVHLDHGVGRYLGLQTLNVGDIQAEYLTLEYAGGDKLYVPVASLHLISRYSGTEAEHAPLHRLGSEQWQKAKRKATEQIRDVAAELLDLYAHRAARIGHAFTNPSTDYAAFVAAFPFEETPDQQLAIENVIKDMTSPKAMDRLICGDVGFGKTEVAMRAAFIAVQEGKQVAILVPTTLLAQQHYQNFKDRFADWPVCIEVISRFRSQQEQKQVIEALIAGKIDIIIGTHKLLQEDIAFQRLGLLIIDEEHRFGVQQKERLKSLRAEVDILALTATPIPRTLNMALSGMRDLSIIATPPARRLSIKTFVREYAKNLIREAILRETLRGGQVYFLHNAVETIERMASELAELVPEARIGIAHGQMRERELEYIMADFYHSRFNLLVCTTIIETGIDVPTANTIIINRADKLGLAQLHQLRGRVGRSHHQAYAYLLTPTKQALSADAEKRLDAIASLEDLGAGFTLATHDLEIRGAGELLGEEQSGNMQTIGFNLYMELLERAVNALKAGKQPALDDSLESSICEIDLQIPSLIPEDYLPDVHNRLILYKRIASASDEEILDEIQVEMIDRFGLLPPAAKNLFLIAKLKLQAKPLGIRKIEMGNAHGRIEFDSNPNIDPMTIIKLLQTQPTIYKLEGPQRLRFSYQNATVENKLRIISELVESLSQKP